MIGQTVAIARRKYAERQAETNHHEAGDEDQFKRRRQELRDVLGHRPVGIERDAEIAMQQLGDEIAILLDDRAVEMQLLAERGYLVRRCIGPERDARGIAGDHPGDGENQHRNPDQNDQ